MSFVSEHEFFSSDSLRLISPHHPHFFTRASTVFSPLCASKICAPDSRLMARYFSYSLLSYPSRSPHTPTAFFVEVRNLP